MALGTYTHPVCPQAELFLEHNPNPVLSLDPEGHVMYLNVAARARFPRLRSVCDNHPVLEGLDDLMVQFQDRRNETVVFVREVSYSSVVYEQQILALPGEGSVFLYMMDITERKRTAEEKQKAAASLAQTNQSLKITNERLVRQNAELDEFAHVCSHDLQEPLRKLISFTEALRRDLALDLPPKAAEDLTFITEAAYRMHRLVNDLLKLSRAGRSEMKFERVALDHCVDAALEALSTRIAETRAAIARDKLPSVMGDAVLLTQLFQNLIGNALKFVPKGCVPSICVTAEQSGNECIIGVKDNGIGIRPEFQERIFAPFKRLHHRNEYEGTGIGLSICRKAVERHHGRIWVESQPDCGSHFKFILNAVWPSE